VCSSDLSPTQLAEVADDRVGEVLGRLKTAFMAGQRELSPAQLLEGLGFGRHQMQTPVRDLSGGEARRLQLLLVLCQEPNLLILDEPTNDVDTDMLAALEDFLDGWPGTLLVVSHDRYLIERVTDQQYALLGGRLRHLPGGVDEYLRLAGAGGGAQGKPPPAEPVAQISAAQADRAQRKELAALERKIAQAEDNVQALQAALAKHDPTDYLGLASLLRQVERAEADRDAWETAWLEAAE
jgi:ABC-type multidrug transport system ATPase subunit